METDGDAAAGGWWCRYCGVWLIDGPSGYARLPGNFPARQPSTTVYCTWLVSSRSHIKQTTPINQSHATRAMKHIIHTIHLPFIFLLNLQRHIHSTLIIEACHQLQDNVS